jgi:hypothetical protein
MPAVGQQLNLAWFARLKADQQPSGDRPAVNPRLGDPDPHQSVALGHVVLPAAPDDRKAMAHQKPVASIGWHRRIDWPRHPVEARQCQAVAAVRHIEKQAMIAARRVLRREDADIGREMHQAVAVALGHIDIGDGAVRRVPRINGEMRCAVKLLVAPDIAEFPTVGERLSGFDL